MWINAMGERWPLPVIAVVCGLLAGLVVMGVALVFPGEVERAVGLGGYVCGVTGLLVMAVPGLAAIGIQVWSAWTMARGYATVDLQPPSGSPRLQEAQTGGETGGRAVRYTVNGIQGELIMNGPDDLLERAWREQCIALLELAWKWEQANSDQVAKGVTGLTVEALVGKGKGLSSAGHWGRLTDVLAFRHSGDGKPGYILKASGQTTMLATGYTYAGAIGEIANGGPLPHPKTYPPMVRKA